MGRGTSWRRRGQSWCVLAVVVCASAALLAGCGSGGDKQASTSGGPKLEHLTLAHCCYTSAPILTYIAIRNGDFRRAGLDVKVLDNQGAALQSLMLSGKVDLFDSGTLGQALSLAGKGQATTIIRGSTGGGFAGYMVGNPSTTPDLATLQRKGSCTIATPQVGTRPYGYATHLVQNLGLKCKVVPYSDAPSMVAAVASKRADAGMAAYPNFATALAAKQVVTLLDPRDPAAAQKYLGAYALEGADWLLTSTLKKKRSAVVKYVKGVESARKWWEAKSDRQVAELLHSFEGFNQQSVDSLTQQIKNQRIFLDRGSDKGYVTSQQWAAVLGATKYDLPDFDANNPKYGYDQRVDMSLFTEATGRHAGDVAP
jgi:ABC-type nitrate/sulfonate/bicarbonate transport system substrate-binding protein